MTIELTDTETTTGLPTLIPLEVLFGNPERTMPQLSPDGTLMAYTAPVDGVLNVWLGEVGSNNFAPLTEDRDRGIRSYRFAPDNKHILYVQDRGGDENWHVYSVDLETRVTTDVTPFDGVQAQVMHVDRRHPGKVMLGINKDDPRLHDAYELDLASGELKMVCKNPGFIGWLVDSDFVPRLGVRADPDSGHTWLIRDGADDDWRDFLRLEPDDSMLGAGPISFSRDGTSIICTTSEGAERGRGVRINVATGERELLVEDPRYDIDELSVNPDTWEPELAGIQGDRFRYVAIDPAIRADLDALAAVQPTSVFHILSRDVADRTWIVGFVSDDAPIAYYAYTRADKKATFLFHHRSDLLNYRLAKMEPFRFTARDGLEVEGYITAPVGVERRKLPAVLYVHGGPWARDVWSVEPNAQWLANRGYVSIQINYRGSTGYGKRFLNASTKEWAGRMHDDLIDGLEWAIAQGWVDRDRVGIFGGSYGGYATLVGMTFTPDVFRCGVDIVGPSSLETLIRSIPPYWEPWVALWHTRVGNPDTEKEFLWSRSPLSRVDDIKSPLLIAQGANDPRVKQAESEQIVAAMKEKGIPYEYMLFPDEGHGFAKPENRLKFWRRADSFLAEYLGGRAES